MSQKLPKENLKKVSGAKGAAAEGVTAPAKSKVLPQREAGVSGALRGKGVVDKGIADKGLAGGRNIGDIAE